MTEGDDEPWSATTRMLVGTSGGALVAYGMTQRFPIACAIGAVGLGLVARAVTNFEMESYLGLGSHEKTGGEMQSADRRGPADQHNGQRSHIPAPKREPVPTI